MLSPIPAVGFGVRAGTGESKKGFPGSCWGPNCLLCVHSFENMLEIWRPPVPKRSPLHLPWFQIVYQTFVRAYLTRSVHQDCGWGPNTGSSSSERGINSSGRVPGLYGTWKILPEKKINLKFRRHKELHWMMMRHPLKRPPGEISSVNGFQVVQVVGNETFVSIFNA